MSDENFYEEFFRPFKNRLKNINLYRALYVIWAYSENIVHSTPFAKDITPINAFDRKTKMDKRISFHEWEMEELATEIIKFSSLDKFVTHEIENPKYLLMIINKLRGLQEELSKGYISPETIHHELFRIAHKQFSWQTDYPNQASLLRYYKIYSNQDIQQLIFSEFDMDLDKIFLITATLWGYHINKFSHELPLKSSIDIITLADIENYLKYFSTDLAEIRKDFKDTKTIDETYFYQLSVLRSFPLIEINYNDKSFLACPIPTLLIWRVTIAIYYDLLKKDLKNNTGFSNLIGNSFQNYVGEVLFKILDQNKFNIYEEESYIENKKTKATIDWVVNDQKSLLFIECKTKRIKKGSKEKLYSSEEFEDDMKTIAIDMLQIYKTILAYESNLYPQVKYKSKIKVYPMLLTLENLYLYDNDSYDSVYSKLHSLLDEEGIDKLIIEKYPIILSSMNEFELLIQIIAQKSIDGVLANKIKDSESKRYILEAYMGSEFPAEVKSLQNNQIFPGEFRKIFYKDPPIT